MGAAIPGLLMFAVFLACVASMIRDGLWSNAVKFINVMTAALLATSLFEGFAGFLENRISSLSYVWDFVSIWLIFVTLLVLFRLATGAVSQTKVRFKRPVDWAGGGLFACLTGWVMVCFTLASLHTAPLSRSFFDGGFQSGPTAKMLLVGPDRLWLGFTQMVSRNSLAGVLETREFDPKSDFIPKYAARRKQFERFPGVMAKRVPMLNAFRYLRRAVETAKGKGQMLTMAEAKSQALRIEPSRTIDDLTELEDGTVEGPTIWIYGPVANGDGRNFKLFVVFNPNGRLVDAYLAWELHPGSYVKDEASSLRGS
jgi:hypothetical protein